MNTGRPHQLRIFLLAILLLTACNTPASIIPAKLSTATPIPVPPTVTSIPIPPTAVGAAATPSTTEADAWQKVQCVDTQSLQIFLTAFPEGVQAGEAKMYLALYQRIEEIRAKRVVSSLVIPFEKLGDSWQAWEKRMPDKGGIGYYVDQNSMGIFSLPGCQTISMDNTGMPITPTGDGSIAAFRTQGLKLTYLNSIVIQSAEGDILHFGVIDGMGLVYLRGKGTVIMPDGKAIELQ